MVSRDEASRRKARLASCLGIWREHVGQTFQSAGSPGFPARCSEPGDWKVAQTGRQECLPYYGSNSCAKGGKKRLASFWLPTPCYRRATMETTQALYDAVLKGDATSAKTLTAQALAAGLPPMTLIQQFMVPAMTEVGRRFEAGEYFVPELLISARAMKCALELVRPLLTAHDRSASSAGLVVIGTVKGDLHDLGKNLVATMLEGGGFEVTDLGVNVTPEQFVKAVKERNPRIVALSALLTTTMPAIKTTLDALQQAGVRDHVKVLIGGAPITRRFAEEVGADGYSETAANVADLARKVLS